MGVNTSNLLIANSGNDLPVRIKVLHYLLVFHVEWFCLFLKGTLGCIVIALLLFHSLQVIDLSRVSQVLAYLASDADLVVLEGMVSSF